MTETEKKNICSPSQKHIPKLYRTKYGTNVETPETVQITDETLSVQVDMEIGDEIGMTSRSLGDITVSNAKNQYSTINPNGDYSNFVVDDEIKIYLNNGDGDLMLFKGIVYKADNREANTAVTLALLSQRELDLAYTNNVILEGKKPWELAKILIEGGLGKSFELKSTGAGDESEKVVSYMSYFEDKVFGELKTITEYAESLIYYSPLHDTYFYVTREKLKQLKESAVTGVVDLLVNPQNDWDTYEIPVTYLLDIKAKRSREIYTNEILGTYSTYTVKHDIVQKNVVYSYKALLQPGVHTPVTKKFTKGEYYQGFTIKYTAGSIFADMSGDDYSILYPELLERNIVCHPNGMSGYVKNLASLPVYVEVEILAVDAYIPQETQKKDINGDSQNLFGRKETDFNNLYCQSLTGLNDYMTSQLVYFNQGEREATITVSGISKVELLDRIMVVGGLDPSLKENDIFGLVKKISHRITPDKGYQTDITLFYMSYLQA